MRHDKELDTLAALESRLLRELRETYSKLSPADQHKQHASFRHLAKDYRTCQWMHYLPNSADAAKAAVGNLPGLASHDLDKDLAEVLESVYRKAQTFKSGPSR
ncbi:MAG: hypothetical protein AAGA84_06610 [Pseudomonadota bacterium]